MLTRCKNVAWSFTPVKKQVQASYISQVTTVSLGVSRSRPFSRQSVQGVRHASWSLHSSVISRQQHSLCHIHSHTHSFMGSRRTHVSLCSTNCPIHNTQTCRQPHPGYIHNTRTFGVQDVNISITIQFLYLPSAVTGAFMANHSYSHIILSCTHAEA